MEQVDPAGDPADRVPDVQLRRRPPSWVWVVTATAVAALVLMAGVAYSFLESTSDRPRQPLSQAVRSCNVSTVFAAVGDDGRSLSIDGQGQSVTSGLSIDQIDCILGFLHFPAAARARMDNTRAIDGMQTAQWKAAGIRYIASWNYHPDAGVNIVIEIQ